MKKQFDSRKVIALVLAASALTCVLMLALFGLYLGAGTSMLKDVRTYIALRRDIADNYIGSYKSDDVSHAALKASVDALGDQWSYYMTPEEYQKYTQSANNQYSGLGLSVKKDDKTGGLSVISVYPGSAAEKAGMKQGDVVTAVDGKSITALGLSDAVALIGRSIGETVKLTVLGADGQTREVSAVYSLVDTNPVSYKMLDGAVGYIQIKNFESGAADAFIKAVNDLKSQGARSFLFDVRNNGGGRVTELTKMLDELLPECDIFVAVEKNGKEDVTRSDAANVKLPAVVLVNKYTFSAAEYFAAALKEYNYAAVVGEHTTGKNRSQITLTLPDGGALHISSGEYLTPKRVSLTEQKGLTPDVALSLSDDDNALLYEGVLDPSKDTQLQKAIEILLK